MATPGASTPGGGATPLMAGTTPVGPKAMTMATPTPSHLVTMTPEQLQAYRWEREIDERNRPLTDDELDTMFPPGYKILNPPAGNTAFHYPVISIKISQKLYYRLLIKNVLTFLM